LTRINRISRRTSMLVIGAILAAAPAQAQTYDPNFPICMQVYGIGGCSITCSYTSIDQCRASASGGGAQCVTNPYFERVKRLSVAPTTPPSAEPR
jgi:Protein of unknown function (DUF3551)